VLSDVAVAAQKLAIHFGAQRVLHEVSFDIPARGIFAIIGPAQSGKTSLLRVLNRTLEFTPQAAWSGHVMLLG
jgi:phosphate transport system ATP-binding protein